MIQTSLYNHFQIPLEPIKIEPKISKFVALIQSKKEIKECCKTKNLVTWLNNKDAELKFADVDEYHRFISPALELASLNDPLAAQIRMKTAMRYANILGRYFPEEDGHLPNLAFNYVQLVKVVKKVFYHHIQSNSSLFVNGIRLNIKNESFLAIVARSVTYIVHEKALSQLGKGGKGIVIAVYELAADKILALKYSENSKDRENLKREFDNLNILHERANMLNLSVEGLQENPFAYFDIQDGLVKLVGCLETRYEICLFEWMLKDHRNAERIAMCKRLVRAYKNKVELGYWHGDIKPENVLIDGNKLAIIDWDGAILFEDIKQAKKKPLTSTKYYLNLEDKRCVEDVMSCRYNTSSLQQQLMDAGAASELFSLGMVLYMILTSKAPFKEKSEYPDTQRGISPEGMTALTNRYYSQAIQDLIVRMLSHYPANRLTTTDVLDFWDGIQ